ncbi:MATE family efflux transporter [Aeromonas hydrophila]|nr:hypothetical protein [Aeromonas hydrophila]
MKSFLFRLGIDKSILYVIMNRGWGVISGVVTLWLITHYLSLELQGYYYTFASILALQIIFELGLGTVLVQFTSHEMPGLKFIEGRLSGSQIRLERLLSLIRFSIKWYSAIAIAIVLFIIPIGIVFFSEKGDFLSAKFSAQWVVPWVSLVIFSALSLWITPILSIAEGCGFVARIAKLRLIQTSISSVLTWTALLSGFGLYATAASSFALFFVGIVWIKFYFYKVIKQAFTVSVNPENSISWKNEILPLQWRIGMSWLCGYFIFNMFNPIAFKFYGAEFAGKLGMSITIVNLMLSLSLSWIMTKAPLFGNYIAQDKKDELNSLYEKTFKQSVVFLSLVIAVANTILFILNKIGIPIVDRLLPPVYFMLLCLTAIGNHIVACQATYVRAHKVEKYLPNAVISAISMSVGLAVVVLLKLPAEYIVVSYFIAIWFICTPHGIWTFWDFKVPHRD